MAVQSNPAMRAWITTNGNLPDEKTFNLVLRSLLKAGIKEIESPGRLWMMPSGHENGLEFFKAFGGVSPIFHLHTHRNKWIVEALEKIGEPRFYGDALMISGQIDYVAAAAKNGMETFEPTIVRCTGQDVANDPIFDFKLRSASAVDRNFVPSRPDEQPSNDNMARLEAA